MVFPEPPPPLCAISRCSWRPYGSLAATIGLMVWMYLSVVVVLIGAAYNAERLALTAAACAVAAQPAPAPASRLP